MAYYSKEVPTGTVDGANTVFNTANSIYQIDDIFIDGAIYLGNYTVSGTEITLSDAPVYSIYVDYYDSSPGGGAGSFTLQSLWDEFLRRKRDLTDVPEATFIMWCRWIQRFAYNKIKNVDPERLYSETQIVASRGSNVSVGVPDGFRDSAGVDAGLWELENGLPTGNKLPKTGFASSRTGYYIYKGYIRFTPLQWGQTKTYSLRWMPDLYQFTALTDSWTIDGSSNGTPVLEEEHLQYMVDAVDVLYEQWDINPGSESYADQRFVRAVN